jgi:hypothetical protein
MAVLSQLFIGIGCGGWRVLQVVILSFINALQAVNENFAV